MRSLAGLTIAVVLSVAAAPLSAQERAEATDAREEPEAVSLTFEPKPASWITARLNATHFAELPFSDTRDFDDAERGFVATLPEVRIETAAGRTVYSLAEYRFLDREEAPDSVNPVLWRLARLNLVNGLFQVTDRIYQVRGFDVSNMTIVEGATGLVVIDPLGTLETAKAAIELYRANRGPRPVRAVIYTHSHLDHYGGVRGVVSDDDVRAGVRVIAPSGFLEAAVSENVFAGNAMSRRATYMFGALLAKGEKGHVDCGIGKAYPTGSPTLIPPTETFPVDPSKQVETWVVDGVEIELRNASGTEAPAEMTLFFPQLAALDSAELACPLMHNVLTLRGAQVRDAKRWSEVLDEELAEYGPRTDVLLAQHHWPRWGAGRIQELLRGQRDLYRFLHDQTLRLANQGYSGPEIAERLTLPKSLGSQWFARGTYGTLRHNVKAIYQKYLGWYDGNPANLDALPPVENARRLVGYMGGSEAAIGRARRDFDRGDYRWVAWVMSQVVFAEPQNWRARYLEADALEQLGYQSEAATWRNAYLTGAAELRNGIPSFPGMGSSAGADTRRAMSLPLAFDFMGIRLNGEKAEGRRLVLNWTVTDPAKPTEQYALNLENSALTYRPGLAPSADVSLTLARSTFDSITLGQRSWQEAIDGGLVAVSGNAQRLFELLALLDTFEVGFPIVTP